VEAEIGDTIDLPKTVTQTRKTRMEKQSTMALTGEIMVHSALSLLLN